MSLSNLSLNCRVVIAVEVGKWSGYIEFRLFQLHTDSCFSTFERVSHSEKVNGYKVEKVARQWGVFNG